MRWIIIREIVRNPVIYLSASPKEEVAKEEFVETVRERWRELGRTTTLRELDESEVRKAKREGFVAPSLAYFIEEKQSE
jgi:hypothetical protein